MWSCNFILPTLTCPGVGGECAVSVELLWNRLSGFISPSHLYLRRNVASGLKPISITFLHFINFRTITRELPFDSCSSSLSCTFLRALRGHGVTPHWTLDFVFLLFAEYCPKALFRLAPKVCGVCQFQTRDGRAFAWTFCMTSTFWRQCPAQTMLPADLWSALRRNSIVAQLRSS